MTDDLRSPEHRTDEWVARQRAALARQHLQSALDLGWMMTDDDDQLIEILRRYPPEIRRAMIAKLEEMRCRLDDDTADRLRAEGEDYRRDEPRDPVIRGEG